MDKSTAERIDKTLALFERFVLAAETIATIMAQQEGERRAKKVFDDALAIETAKSEETLRKAKRIAGVDYIYNDDDI